MGQRRSHMPGCPDLLRKGGGHRVRTRYDRDGKKAELDSLLNCDGCGEYFADCKCEVTDGRSGSRDYSL